MIGQHFYDNPLFSNGSKEEKFISCILKHNKMLWSCNLELLNMHDAEKWLDLQNDTKKSNHTVLIPYNCEHTPDYIKKMIVNYKLNNLIKKYYVP